MRFSHIAVAYLLIGAIIIGAGVVPPSEAGLLDEFVDIEQSENDELENVDDGTDREQLGGIITPVQNALDTITGGAIMGIWQMLSSFIGYVAWPITVTRAINAPSSVVLIAGVMTASFVFGTLRVLKASI